MERSKEELNLREQRAGPEPRAARDGSSTGGWSSLLGVAEPFVFGACVQGMLGL